MTRTLILIILSVSFSLVPNAFVQANQQSAGTTHLQNGRTADLTNSSQIGQNITLVNPLGAGTDLPTLLADILQLVVRVGTVAVILMLVYIGFLFVTAQGEPAKIQQARSALLWTIVGALLLLGAEAIAQGISATVTALSTGN